MICSNRGNWIQSLLVDYKKDLNEKKLNLDDDYIKFIRYGQYFIEKNREGILAYISNNSFIDGITHRQMRKSLMQTFDKIYIFDLHGNSKKQETAADGTKDENVFDIMQGVSINIFVKDNSKKQKGLANVFYTELFGLRSEKYKLLLKSSINSIEWKKLEASHPNYFFVPKDFNNFDSYSDFFSFDDLFLLNNTGIQTKRDKFVYSFTESELKSVINDLQKMGEDQILCKYDLPENGRDWTVQGAKDDINNNLGNIIKVNYHPFDQRFTYFTGKSKGFMAYPRSPLMNNAFKNNIFLLAVRNSRRGNVNNFFISDIAVDKDAISPFDNCKFFPLYLYTETESQLTNNKSDIRKTNFNANLIDKIGSRLKLKFTSEKQDIESTFASIDLLDYIYAVLYSPTYRETYQEFLKIDFPRVPYPDPKNFWELVKLGGELRQLHMLESPTVEKFITTYPNDGDNVITRKINRNDFELTGNGLGRVWINDQQYFDQVPVATWEFYIGGYQPAQKWLKDRFGRTLGFEDIQHYQKIIVALAETMRVMQTIDEVWKP